MMALFRFPKGNLLFLLFLSLLVFGGNLLRESLWENGKEEKRLLQGIRAELGSQEQEFLAFLEWQSRVGSLPFYAEETGNRILREKPMESLQIFDDSFRKIFAFPKNNQVFSADLRLFGEPLPPGKTRSLPSGDLVYRTKKGDFFFQFRKPLELPRHIRSPAFETSLLYWVFQETTGQIIFSNDRLVLSGEKEGPKIHNLLQGKENQIISYQIDGSYGRLASYKLENKEVFVLKPKRLVPKGVWERSFLYSSFFFSFLLFLLLLQKKDALLFSYLTQDKVKSILIFLGLVVLYGSSQILFPEERRFDAWVKSLKKDSIILLENLDIELRDYQYKIEKNQAPLFSLEPSLVQDIQIVENKLSDQIGSVDIRSLLNTQTSRDYSILYPWGEQLLFLTPKKQKSETEKQLIALLSPKRFQIKKEKDRDLFFFFQPREEKNKNQGPEKFFPLETSSEMVWLRRPVSWTSLEPWLSFFPFSQSVYESPAKAEETLLFQKFRVYRNQGVWLLLPLWSFGTFLPLLGVFWFRSFRKKRTVLEEREIVPEVLSQESLGELIHEEAKIEPTPEPIAKVESSPEEKPEPEVSKKEWEESGMVVERSAMVHPRPRFYPPSSWKKSEKRELQKKREAIFTPELRELVKEVQTKPLAAVAPMARQPVPSISQRPKNPDQELFDSVYRGLDVSFDGVLEYLKFFSKKIGSRFSLLTLNTHLGSYVNTFSSGLDYSTKSNLIFLYKDPFFQFDSGGFQIVSLTEEMRRDTFLSKKFSWEILSQSESIVAYDISRIGFEGLFVMLLNPEETQRFSDSDKRTISSHLVEMVPALYKVAREEWEESEVYEDTLTWLTRSFLHATMGGQRRLFVSRIIWENFVHDEVSDKKKKTIFETINKKLEKHDLILETSSNSFMVLSEKDIKAEIVVLLKNFPFPYDLKFMNYPNDGENYYLYL